MQNYGAESCVSGFSYGSVVKNLPANAGEIQVSPWVEKVPWRRGWQPTPVSLLGKCHGQRSLAGYSPWGHKKSYVTKHACTSCVLQLQGM